MRVVLASASPRRRELLKMILDDFEVIPSNADETPPKEIYSEMLAEYLAEKKAKDISSRLNGDFLVIGCDTCVIVGGKVLGKPIDKADAHSMLKKLSGRKHKVITGCCVVFNDYMEKFSEETYVEFYELSDKEIDDYIMTGEPMDKAGAYGIQGGGALFVKSIEGDYYNVVGLPVSRLSKEIKKIHF